MGKDIKILIFSLGLTFLLIIVFVLWQGKSPGETLEPESTVKIEGVEVTPEDYDLGDVPIKGGIVTRGYEIGNTTERALKLKKITTSCMCTTASVSVGDKETRFFGMEGHGDKNPSVNLEIGPDQIGKVVVRFDPAAHGPQGVGLFDRSVWLTFSDPVGVKELKFNGTVVAN
ncbi:hypothetical protein A2686_03955 [Candidatus Woesebacteria bacterium RIFCSPHIGHO2_01_FULL_38_10]|uniref:DUF1573 domain-containing protein n=1 Tax=Candidatus Woesebacteria bacterium RIFCSPLOWO2_01_FULL_39_10b TaxID=1802517 RepID=A0A1F8B7L4_9BACT|nr:MAG: hypothetical protein A2686_03955 [Candidatus Woesebacteria bacterium RIFCSPHIGHO2_01_FULL_38_10]OGM60001.1 MAG: hypothetical protein A2892_03840 [Candidatus Woesebacteria bacterium RIFCSPLOWO2_01_FULL_39_10b]